MAGEPTSSDAMLVEESIVASIVEYGVEHYAALPETLRSATVKLASLLWQLADRRLYALTCLGGWPLNPERADWVHPTRARRLWQAAVGLGRQIRESR